MILPEFLLKFVLFMTITFNLIHTVKQGKTASEIVTKANIKNCAIRETINVFYCFSRLIIKIMLEILSFAFFIYGVSIIAKIQKIWILESMIPSGHKELIMLSASWGLLLMVFLLLRFVKNQISCKLSHR